MKIGLTFHPFAVFVHNSNAGRLLQSCHLLLGDLNPIESNNKNVVEDSTFHNTPAIFFIQNLVALEVSLEDREGLDYVGGSILSW